MIVSILKKIRPRQLLRLAGIFFRHPLYAFPTIRATIKCMRISENKYGKAHHGDNRPNAFRHALWNVLIARYCLAWRKGMARALSWTEKITTWHESFSKNDPLATAMDLHNNKIGRSYVAETFEASEISLIDWITEKANKAQRVTSVSDIDLYPSELVFISESC